MKKLLLVCFQLALLLTTASAQPPQYSLPQGTTNNIFPFGSATQNKVQWLYLPTDFTTAPPSGSITKIYFKTWNNTYSATYSNFTIRMIQNTMTSFTSGTYLTGATTVFTATSQAVPSTGSYSWFSFTLQNPFPYTAGNTLIVEIEHNGISGSITANCTNGSSRRIYGSYGSSTGTVSSGMGDIGIDIQTGPPCPSPTGVSATNILSTSATLNWNAVSGSTGYDYIIDQNATVPFPNTPTTTTATTVNATGLTPATQYYFHVRNKCSPTNPSPWVDYSFTTLPPCNPPTGFHTTNLTPDSATINWAPWPSALTYDYIVDQSPNTPTSTTGATNTSLTSAKITGLTEYTVYYVHIRSNCPGGQQSGWSLDSFRTPVPCRAPVISIDHINTDQAVAHWPAVLSAYKYEYVLSKSATPPDFGTEIIKTSILTSALQDGKDYYIHIRSHCNSLGILSSSPWATASFKTFPAGVNTVANDGFGIETYPNPVKDIITVKLTGRDNTTGQIAITDLSGRQLVSLEVNSDQVNVDMGQLPAGLYLLRYNDPKHTQNIKINKK